MSNKQLENSFDIEGQVVYIGKPESFGKMHQHRKRILAIKIYEGKYEVSVPIEFLNKNMDKLNGLSIGDTVIVNFQISGNMQTRDGQARWYSRIKGRSAQKL